MTRQLLYGATAFLLVLPAVFGTQEPASCAGSSARRSSRGSASMSYGIYLWHKDLLIELVNRHDLLGWVPSARFLSTLAVVVAVTIAVAAAIATTASSGRCCG